jgi:hypothetical protein
MEILEGLEPVRPRPVHGAIGWIGPDGRDADQHRHPDRSSRTVGGLRCTSAGGITWKSDPAAEWEETVSKARGPLGAIGGRGGVSDRIAVERAAAPRLGRRRVLPADEPQLSVFDRGFQLGDGIFETLARPGARPTELPSTSRASRGRRRARHRCRTTSSAAGDGIAALLAAEGLDGPSGDASVRITVSRGPFRGRGCCRPTRTSSRPSRSRPGRSAAAAGHLERGSTRRLGRAPRPGQPARRRSRRRRAPTTSMPGSRPAAPAPTTPSS